MMFLKTMRCGIAVVGLVAVHGHVLGMECGSPLVPAQNSIENKLKIIDSALTALAQDGSQDVESKRQQLEKLAQTLKTQEKCQLAMLNFEKPNAENKTTGFYKMPRENCRICPNLPITPLSVELKRLDVQKEFALLAQDSSEDARSKKTLLFSLYETLCKQEAGLKAMAKCQRVVN